MAKSKKQTLLDLVRATRPAYHPVIEMLDLIDVMELDDTNTLVLAHTPAQRFNMHSKVAEYLEPKLKSVEHTGEVDHKIEVVLTVED